MDVMTLTDTRAHCARVAALLVVALAVAIVGATPATALAANAYGQNFAGQQKCLSCHGNSSGRWQVGTYTDTAHSRFVTNVEEDTSALVPGPSYWPSPAYGGGYSFAASDIKFMLGAPGIWHQYVTKYKNDGPHLLGSGQTLQPIAGPADDLIGINGAEWITEHNIWENLSKTSARTYFQSCGGCHFLGVTRPTDIEYTLGSGATVDHSTETSYSGFGIQCEHCHGTGIADNNIETGHWTAGTRVVRTKQALDSQVCGQCHVNGTAKEKNYTGAALFGSANGYTPDRDLADFFDVAGTNYIWESASDPKPTISASDPKFYPNGSNKGMKHAYYNEWQIGAHARSLRWKDGELWSPYAQEMCLSCHSGEGFLTSLGYGEDGPNDVALGGSSLATDELDIECGVCHTIHAKTGEPLGLRLEAEELCSKCHNGLIPEGGEFAPGAAVHHPHREMRNGYGLIGVETPAERFMEDTTCPQCHMPNTKYTLNSHSFRVMKPGDAATWNVQAGGDSCTPCHASKTRAQLQANLDEWAEDLEDLTAEATAAIAAAQGRPAGSTAAGQLLIGSALTNVHYVEADGSHGAHNYPYAKAGLEKAAYFGRSVGASFTRFGATSYSSSMKMAMLYGTLKMGDNAPAAGERVTVLAKPGGTNAWTEIGRATVGDDGDFGFAVGPTGTTAYKVVWSPRSNVDIYSTVATVQFYTSTSANVSASRIRRGKSVTISGAVSPTHSGKQVTVFVKKGTGAFAKLTTRTLNSSSAYSYGWRPSSTGTYYVRTTFAGDPSHSGSTSAVRKVVVR